MARQSPSRSDAHVAGGNSVNPLHLSLLAIALATTFPVEALAENPTVSTSSQGLPIFNFLSQSTEAVATPFTLGKTSCNPRPVGITRCEQNIGDMTPIGDAQMIALTMEFNNGKLFAVNGVTIGAWFQNLANAFTAKYGAPNATETRKWQNKLGMTFDNPTMIWHFKGGDLVLSQMGDQRDSSSFLFFSDENSPPKPKPVINF
jgi:hypothetical protein